MAVHAGCPVFRNLVGQNVCRDRDDRDARPVFADFQLTDAPRRLDPVHVRHLHIHQDDIDIATNIDRGDRLQSAIGLDDVDIVLGQHALQDEAVGCDVVDDEGDKLAALVCPGLCFFGDHRGLRARQVEHDRKDRTTALARAH